MALVTHPITMLNTEIGNAQNDELRRLFIGRRRELTQEIQNRVRDVRTEAAGKSRPSTDPAEIAEVDPDDDLALALIQMKSQVLKTIDEAVQRLDEGTFGQCGDCGAVIAPARLRALPFAVRCRECQERREQPGRHRTH
jgi:DnaK suppressor protein